MNFIVLIPFIVLTQSCCYCMEKTKPLAAVASSFSTTNTADPRPNSRSNVLPNQQPPTISDKTPESIKNESVPAEIAESAKSFWNTDRAMRDFWQAIKAMVSPGQATADKNYDQGPTNKLRMFLSSIYAVFQKGARQLSIANLARLFRYAQVQAPVNIPEQAVHPTPESESALAAPQAPVISEVPGVQAISPAPPAAPSRELIISAAPTVEAVCLAQSGPCAGVAAASSSAKTNTAQPQPTIGRNIAPDQKPRTSSVFVEVDQSNEKQENRSPWNACSAVPKGLANRRNVCFINSVVQSLAALDKLMMAISLQTYEPNSIASVYQNFMKQYFNGQNSDAAHEALCDQSFALMGSPQGRQQDTNEYLIHLLDHLMQEDVPAKILAHRPKYPNSVGKTVSDLSTLFYARTTNVIIYNPKQFRSSSTEYHVSFDLPLESEEDTSLYECLRNYFDGLAPDYVLPTKEVVTAQKEVRINEVQDYVFLTVRTTTYDKHAQQPRRLHTKITFPLKGLDFRDYYAAQDQNTKINNYNLSAFILHRGTAQAGHYIAFVCKNEQWYRCNDGSIDLVDSNLINTISSRGSYDDMVPVLYIYKKMDDPTANPIPSSQAPTADTLEPKEEQSKQQRTQKAPPAQRAQATTCISSASLQAAATAPASSETLTTDPRTKRNGAEQRVMNALERMTAGEEPPLVCKWEKCTRTVASIPGGIPREMRDCIDSFKLEKQGRGLVLYGNPGVGKSTYAEVIATETNRRLARINSADFQTKWKASGQKRVHELFEQAEQQEDPVILLIEEIDGAANEEYKHSPDMVQTCYALLDALDRIKNNKKVFLIFTSNHFDKLPATLKSRLETTLMIPLPDWAERKALLDKMFRIKRIEVSEELIRKLADQTKDYSRRELENFVNKAERQLQLRLLRSENRTNRLALQNIDCALADNRLILESTERRELLNYWLREQTSEGMQSKIEYNVDEAIPEELEQVLLAAINICLKTCASKGMAEIQLIKKNAIANEARLELNDLDAVRTKFQDLLFDPAVFRYIILRLRYTAKQSGFAELFANSAIINLIPEFLRNARYEHYEWVATASKRVANENEFSQGSRIFIKFFEDCVNKKDPKKAEVTLSRELDDESSDSDTETDDSSSEALSVNSLPAVLEEIILHSINTHLNQSDLRLTKRGIALDTHEYPDLRPAFIRNAEVFNYVARELAAAQLDPLEGSLFRIDCLLAIKYLRNANFTDGCSLQRLAGTDLDRGASRQIVKKVVIPLARNLALHPKHYFNSTVTKETVQKVAELTQNCTSEQIEKIFSMAATCAVKYNEIELQDVHLLMGLYDVVAEVRRDVSIRKKILAYLLHELATEEAIKEIAGDLASGAEDFTLEQLENIIRKGREWAKSYPNWQNGQIQFFVGLYLVHREMSRGHTMAVKYRTEKNANVFNQDYVDLQEDMPNGKVHWANSMEIIAALFYELNLPGVQHTISEKCIGYFAGAYTREERPAELGIYEDPPRISCYGIMRIVQEATKIAHERENNNVVTEDDFSKAAWNYCKFAFGSYKHSFIASVALSNGYVLASGPVNLLRSIFRSDK